jgi:hypothetical protein
MMKMKTKRRRRRRRMKTGMIRMRVENLVL